MTLARAGFEPAQRGHNVFPAPRSNHSATGQGQSGDNSLCDNIRKFVFFFFFETLPDGETC